MIEHQTERLLSLVVERRRNPSRINFETILEKGAVYMLIEIKCVLNVIMICHQEVVRISLLF